MGPVSGAGSKRQRTDERFKHILYDAEGPVAIITLKSSASGDDSAVL
jgi:hypothetical protein